MTTNRKEQLIVIVLGLILGGFVILCFMYPSPLPYGGLSALIGLVLLWKEIKRRGERKRAD
jgi:hypothetical protein